MVNLYFSLLFSCLMFSGFFTYSSLSAANHALRYIPVEIFMKNTFILNVSDYEDIYFNIEDLKIDLNSYFKGSLRNKLPNYTLNYIFYEGEDKNICLSRECNSIKITLSADIYFGYHYEKSVTYSIMEA